MLEEKRKLVRVLIPEGMYEKIIALIESENQLKSTGPVTVSDWLAWSASYCLEKQTRAIRAFGRSTFKCDGCDAILRYTALGHVFERSGEKFAYCTECVEQSRVVNLNSAIGPRANPSTDIQSGSRE